MQCRSRLSNTVLDKLQLNSFVCEFSFMHWFTVKSTYVIKPFCVKIHLGLYKDTPGYCITFACQCKEILLYECRLFMVTPVKVLFCMLQSHHNIFIKSSQLTYLKIYKYQKRLTYKKNPSHPSYPTLLQLSKSSKGHRASLICPCKLSFSLALTVTHCHNYICWWKEVN